MKRTFVFIFLMLWVAACAPAPTAVSSALAPAPKKSGTLRVGFTSNADMADVPSLMAHELLRQEGYTVETQFFAGADLEVAALSKGDLDVGNGSTRTHWAAVAKGAHIVTVMEESADVWSLVAKNDIQTCGDLEGQRTAYSSAGALNAALVSAYIGQNCPGTIPQVMYISDSGVRATAMLKGELDVTPLELADLLDVQKKAPDKFRVLVNFAAELPQVKTTGVHVQSDFAKNHPDIVRDYIRALLTVHRDIRANPKMIQDAAVEFLKMDPVEATTASNAYLTANIWDVNGGLGRDAVAYSVDFFTRTGSLPQGLTADKVSDLSYLDAVLNEIGRK